MNPRCSEFNRHVRTCHIGAAKWPVVEQCSPVQVWAGVGETMLRKQLTPSLLSCGLHTVCGDGGQAGPSSHSRCVPQAGGRAGFREPVVGGPPGLEEQGVAVEEPTDELRFDQINQREDCKNTF